MPDGLPQSATIRVIEAGTVAAYKCGCTPPGGQCRCMTPGTPPGWHDPSWWCLCEKHAAYNLGYQAGFEAGSGLLDPT